MTLIKTLALTACLAAAGISGFYIRTPEEVTYSITGQIDYSDWNELTEMWYNFPHDLQNELTKENLSSMSIEELCKIGRGIIKEKVNKNTLKINDNISDDISNNEMSEVYKIFKQYSEEKK